MLSVETMPMNYTARHGLEGTRHADVVNPRSTNAMTGECIREAVMSRKDNITSSMLTHEPDLQVVDGYTGEGNCPTKVMRIVLRYRKSVVSVVK